ncbi:sarcosine oxidase subunit gamma family protein [Bosea sp. ASV33]|uniref:sarcosine oxidase subunit gamma n=1 Tax=Bosea sp. ASV33 TaxID=2795106 RepID=UPI0018ED6256|nr:sarcosine oxidase subunit gamma family protein [Bosea sp. ASV33]
MSLTTAPAVITEPASTTRISLRIIDPAAVGAGLGLAFPTKIGARTVAGARSVLCLGPDEWLVQAPEREGEAMTEALAAIGTTLPLSAVDISDREITLALSGPAVLDLLAIGCPRDLAQLPVGSGCRTLFDTVQVVLTREAPDRFHLTVWRSFAPHLQALLDIALRELATGL